MTADMPSSDISELQTVPYKKNTMSEVQAWQI